MQIWELAKIYGEDNFIHKTVLVSIVQSRQASGSSFSGSQYSCCDRVSSYIE